MSTLKSGLWKATVRGVPDVEVLTGHLVGYYLDDDVVSAIKVDDITDARLLIVLDLGERQRREYVVEILREARHAWTNAVADQIEAQTTPARIEEPGLWGVVKAGWPDDIGAPCHWMRDEYGWTSHGGTTLPWERLIEPVLIREGVTK